MGQAGLPREDARDDARHADDREGVVLLIAPWNFPTSMVFLPLIAVIAAGNTVIIKPSEVSSHTAHALNEVLSKTFDKRFLAVVEGGVAETTDLLKQRFDHIVYTGCASVAKVIMAAAAKHLTPVTLELGGKCPAIVESDADIGVAAKRIAWGKWLNVGQVCLAPDYIIATEAVKPRLVDALRKALEEFFGPDFKTASDYSRVINERHFDRVSGLLDKTQGVVLYKGGDRDRSDCFIPPVIVGVQPGDALMEEEIFGPILPIVTVRNFNEALELIRNGEKPLAAYVFTRDEHKVKRVVAETHSGAVTVNDVLMHFC
ncbi:Protein ALH-4 a, partial [Aphelenchoides avenae]